MSKKIEIFAIFGQTILFYFVLRDLFFLAITQHLRKRACISLQILIYFVETRA